MDAMTAVQHPTTSKGQVPAERAGGTTVAETTRGRAVRFTLAGLRLALGWVFLWAFLDKMFGLGMATPAKGAWIDGGSPTKGFLGKAVAGPFEGVYHGIAGAAWADWLFMIGLVAIGTALILGVGLRVAAVAGSALLVLMWSAVLPPENNPFMDDHLIYAGVLVLIALTAAGDTLGLGKVWASLPIVKRLPWLK
ncbi:DoxX family membrane protein [Amorphoplanes nipponensis]|uniref:Membrane protein n=2 Tax=Actinoplanes nipponensis TaxID=135950 RepID=A0A919JPJ9_9ACTN|nr:membrane protein [Actinoplanes nipponensis]